MRGQQSSSDPLVTEPRAAGAEVSVRTSDPAEEEQQQEARMLILEDNEWDAELAERLLRNSGLRFTTVVVAEKSSFTEQLTAFQPDVILSDYSLPGFTGEDALKIAQQRCPQIPFVIWSGVLGDEVAVALIKEGATDYILKDRPARLPSAIKRALAEASSRARLARLEEQLAFAQHLASLGQLAAAEQAVKLTREMLAAARSQPADGNTSL